ncbi:hypothetical protein Salat_2921600 [Sesamum alatum]|uniref:DUF4283 domain-containing protein n=1 Tax=Sesamum alatum TaxID=300844 RepID=A0AAE2C895_9LAMI|nr:hypothetical protein Salat_2921600 [Sesamum alatum]
MDCDFTDLGKRLSLTEEETGTVNIPSNIWTQTENGEFAVIGKVLSRKWVNFETLRIALFRMINPRKVMRVRSLNEERFMIFFNHPIDLKCTMESGPWIFDKQLIVLRIIAANQNPLDINLDRSTFTIFIHDLPFGQRTQALVMHIGNAIGEVQHLNWDETFVVSLQEICIWV